MPGGKKSATASAEWPSYRCYCLYTAFLGAPSWAHRARSAWMSILILTDELLIAQFSKECFG